MGINLDALAELYKSMASQRMSKTKFVFRFRKLLFSVVYIAEKFPHELLLGCHTHDLYIVVHVDRNFIIGTYLGDDYQPLLDALELRNGGHERFSPNVFFTAFAASIPRNTNPTNAPTIEEIASVRRDVDEAHKIYFVGWLHHDGIRSRPTEDNLAKTRRICGYAVYEVCRRYHISSKWSDVQRDRQAYYEPKA